MEYTPLLLSHIKQSEGLRLRAYSCPAGVLTIGYGHTRGVKRGDVITLQQAEEFLRSDVGNCIRQITPLLRVPITPPQADAIIDFVFNLGIGKFRSSTLLKRINAQAPPREIQLQFLRWDKANGQTLTGLSLRCQWRAARWGSKL